MKKSTIYHIWTSYTFSVIVLVVIAFLSIPMVAQEVIDQFAAENMRVASVVKDFEKTVKTKDTPLQKVAFAFDKIVEIDEYRINPGKIPLLPDLEEIPEDEEIIKMYKERNRLREEQTKRSNEYRDLRAAAIKVIKKELPLISKEKQLEYSKLLDTLNRKIDGLR